MRDYSNIPALRLQFDHEAALRASAQILREEPVILVLPKGSLLSPGNRPRCRREHGSNGLIDCSPEVLENIAQENNLPLLRRVRQAAEARGARVDIDPLTCRLIVHA